MFGVKTENRGLAIREHNSLFGIGFERPEGGTKLAGEADDTGGKICFVFRVPGDKESGEKPQSSAALFCLKEGEAARDSLG